MGKKIIAGVTFDLLKQLHFSQIDIKNLAFEAARMDQGNKVCFDQLNSIFAKN